MPYTKVSEKQIYYEEYGSVNKPTVLYLHGGPGESCLTYSYQAKKLGEYCHVISFDQHGVFRSDALPENSRLSVNELVEMTEQMRIELDIKSWIPLGHSFGGMLALIYAHNYPDSTNAVIYDNPMWSALHTARAIAEATLPSFEKANNTEQTTLCKEILQDGISAKEAFEKSMSIEMNDDVRRHCHVIDTDSYNAYINEHIEDPQVPEECWGKFIAFRQSLFDSEDFYENYLPYLSDISKPQLLIVGEYDMTCGEYERNYFSEHAQNGTLEPFAGCAHLSWFEEPQKYTETIARFVLSLTE
ncbi:proline iminopeptidase [Ruminococcus sp. YE71]|uniref:alpha/beta fold hydrolase n=1 Tax=unclassified Ruminococcus TaxID=2608920 RepID=UPI00088AAC00|nr:MULTISPECIES: alpha/beta hydrolase [unclassified Ruminococcus]SDA32907.1 proline iminopeptidase [Ruminococcus sp. YE78]SFW53902.1 proline iminopeptidase [Ruminococcus sp. YE71]